MKKQFLNILLSAILTLTVTDYIWVLLVQDHENVVVELESKEAEEEIQEAESTKTRSELDFFDSYIPFESQSLAANFSHFVTLQQNSDQLNTESEERLYIYFKQLKLDC